jgi:hypothetical protein
MLWDVLDAPALMALTAAATAEGPQDTAVACTIPHHG